LASQDAQTSSLCTRRDLTWVTSWSWRSSQSLARVHQELRHWVEAHILLDAGDRPNRRALCERVQDLHALREGQDVGLALLDELLCLASGDRFCRPSTGSDRFCQPYWTW
jgi:hypothetical protein